MYNFLFLNFILFINYSSSQPDCGTPATYAPSLTKVCTTSPTGYTLCDWSECLGTNGQSECDDDFTGYTYAGPGNDNTVGCTLSSRSYCCKVIPTSTPTKTPSKTPTRAPTQSSQTTPQPTPQPSSAPTITPENTFKAGPIIGTVFGAFTILGGVYYYVFKLGGKETIQKVRQKAKMVIF